MVHVFLNVNTWQFHICIYIMTGNSTSSIVTKTIPHISPFRIDFMQYKIPVILNMFSKMLNNTVKIHFKHSYSYI